MHRINRRPEPRNITINRRSEFLLFETWAPIESSTSQLWRAKVDAESETVHTLLLHHCHVPPMASIWTECRHIIEKHLKMLAVPIICRVHTFGTLVHRIWIMVSFLSINLASYYCLRCPNWTPETLCKPPNVQAHLGSYIPQRQFMIFDLSRHKVTWNQENAVLARIWKYPSMTLRAHVTHSHHTCQHAQKIFSGYDGVWALIVCVYIQSIPRSAKLNVGSRGWGREGSKWIQTPCVCWTDSSEQSARLASTVTWCCWP